MALDNQQDNRQQIIEKAILYLNKHRILTMATSNREGDPDATALEYANDGLDVYVSVRPKSRKVSNITENPKLFYEIHDDIDITAEAVGNIQAIQVLAHPTIISFGDPGFNDSFLIMINKFPVFKRLNKEKRTILKFTPKKLWFLDYSKKFFHRDEVKF
jgi:pyridoxamine 5'-phosphate oxidase-like protein